MIVQLPLPDHLDGTYVTGLVDAAKDVDGLTALSTRACFRSGGLGYGLARQSA